MYFCSNELWLLMDVYFRFNDTMVKMSLPEDNKNILTSQYQLYLPSKEQLIEQVNEVKQTVQTKTGKAKM